MSNYTPLKSYKVCAVISTSDGLGISNSLRGTDPYTEPFATYDEAERWINDHGHRQVTYTIVEVFRKP